MGKKIELPFEQRIKLPFEQKIELPFEQKIELPFEQKKRSPQRFVSRRGNAVTLWLDTLASPLPCVGFLNSFFLLFVHDFAFLNWLTKRS
jgi:hypothetical protein